MYSRQMKQLLATLTLIITLATAANKKSCYDSWYVFLNAVESSFGNEEFVICPGTTFNPYPIFSNDDYFTDVWIYEDNIKIKCGDNGRLEDACTFNGGMTHLYIPRDDITGIEVSGITFVGANETSIMAYGKDTSEVTFNDCVWKGNSGDEGAAFNIWNNYDDYSSAMTVNLNRCSFINNESEKGVINNEGGTVNIQHTAFNSNEGGWPVEVRLNGEASVSNSCFENNDGGLFFYDDSEFTKNKDNFGNANNKDGFDCNGGYKSKVSFCVDFKADECKMDLTSDAKMNFSRFVATALVASGVLIGLI